MSPKRIKPKQNRFLTDIAKYGTAVLAVGVATGLSYLLTPYFGPSNLVMIYILGTLAVALQGHRGPAAASAALSVLAFDYFFVPPRYSFRVSDVEYLMTFAAMFITAMVISHLTVRLRSEASLAEEGQMRTMVMNEFSQELAGARSLDGILKIAVNHLAKTFDSTVVAFIPNRQERLEAKGGAGGDNVTDKEIALAQWVYDRAEAAGLGTNALPVDPALTVPLIGTQGSVGVLRVTPREKESLTAPEQRPLFDSFVRQIALALEVNRLQESTRKAEVEAETERLRSALLSSVSHDFRTPLTAIVGSASSLLNRDEIRKSRAAMELAETIQSEGERLARLVENILETTRLASGEMRLRKELYPLDEVVGNALERLAGPLERRNITVRIPPDFPLIPMDGVLIEQVLMNLLENVIRHTPAGTPASLSAFRDKSAATVSVEDEGAGLKENQLERVFDKFFHDPSSPGAGLGLAICRAIINTHGGRIWAENVSPHGAMFRFTLPLQNQQSHGN